MFETDFTFFPGAGFRAVSAGFSGVGFRFVFCLLVEHSLSILSPKKIYLWDQKKNYKFGIIPFKGLLVLILALSGLGMRESTLLGFFLLKGLASVADLVSLVVLYKVRKNNREKWK